MARSTYFYHQKRLRSADKYVSIKQELIQLFQIHKGRYGYRRMTVELHKKGIHINHKTVFRLMGELGLSSVVRRRKRAYNNGEAYGIVPNLLNRNFSSCRPLTRLVTDVTEFHLFDKKIYLSPVMDLFNREIICYSIASSPNINMVKEMLDGLYTKPCPRDAVIHSDQGALYQSKWYQDSLRQHGFKQSMSRRGNCLDNAVIENFFGIVKTEFFYQRKFQSIQDFINGLKLYIKYYNHKRIKIKLDGLSPVKYRLTKFAS